MGGEVIGDGLRAALGEPLVVVSVADVVRVAGDAAGDELQAGQGFHDFVQRGLAGVGELGGVEGEFDFAADIAGAALRADAFTLRRVRALVDTIGDAIAIAVGRCCRRRWRGWGGGGGGTVAAAATTGSACGRPPKEYSRPMFSDQRSPTSVSNQSRSARMANCVASGTLTPAPAVRPVSEALEVTAPLRLSSSSKLK
jgi:hypothetical protein